MSMGLASWARAHRAAIERWTVAALVLAGAALRLRQYAFNRSLWYDEALLANIVVGTPPGGLVGAVSGAPLGFLVPAKLASLFLGERDWALRLVPLAAGLASLPLMARVSRSVFRETAARACAVGLLSFASVLVYYSSEFKPYIIDVAATLVILAVAADFGREEGDGRDALALAAAGSICVWLSYTAVFVLAGAGIVLWAEAAIAKRWNTVIRVTAAGATWLASFSAAWALTLRPLADDDWLNSYWASGYAPSPLVDLHWYRDTAIAAVSLAFGTARPIGADPKLEWLTTPNLLLASLAALGLASLACLGRRSARLFSMIAITIAVAIVASAFKAYPLRGRLLLFFVPVVFLALAALVEALGRSRHVAANLAAGLLAAALVAWPLAGAVETALAPANQSDIKSAMAAIRDGRRPGDVAAISSWSRPAFEFYARTYGLGDLPVLLWLDAYNPDLGFLPAMRARPGTGRVWVLFSHRFSDRMPLLRDADAAAGRLSSYEGSGAGAYLYDFSTKAGAPPPSARTGP